MDISRWFFTAIASFVLYAGFYRWVLYRNLRGPKVWPILGCALEVAKNRWRMHDFVWDYCKKHYPTFRMRMPGFDYVISVDPADIEYVLKTNFSNYDKGEMQHLFLGDLLGDGIFNVDGNLWKRQRKVASYEFASNVLRDFNSQNFKMNAVHLCQILKMAAEENKPMDMMDLMLRLTFESICQMGFGINMGLLLPSLPEVPFAINFEGATTRASDRFVDPLWQLKKALNIGPEAAMKRNVKIINSFTKTLVESRKEELETGEQTKPDLLSRFVAAVNNEPFTSNPTKDLQDVVTNFILAGRDTTGVSLAWFLYSLSCNPRVQDKILDELLRLESQAKNRKTDDNEVPAKSDTLPEGEFSDFARLLDYETVGKMYYLQAALSESMRLHAPVPADLKVPLQDDVLPSGEKMCRGDVFMYSAYAQGRMEQVWGSDVLEYKPERWLKDGVYQQESPYKYPVFNAGPRLCLGKDSAYLQMKITMAMLLRFFTFKVVPGHRVAYKVTITLHMENGLKMIVQRR